MGHPSFGRIFKCECKLRQEDHRRLEDLRQLSNLDAFGTLTFDSFQADVPGLDEAFEAAFVYAQEPDGWLFLHGGCGTGKTHLAVAIAQSVMANQGMSVLFAVVPDLLDHLRATFDPGSGTAYDDRFTAIRNAHLLVLDDLGTENTTPWAREKLYQIFNHRYNERLPTVITSNLDFKRIEERVLSRILDRRLTRFVQIDAEDFRTRNVLPPRHHQRPSRR